jgi:hypothetical protein
VGGVESRGEKMTKNYHNCANHVRKLP